MTVNSCSNTTHSEQWELRKQKWNKREKSRQIKGKVLSHWLNQEPQNSEYKIQTTEKYIDFIYLLYTEIQILTLQLILIIQFSFFAFCSNISLFSNFLLSWHLRIKTSQEASYGTKKKKRKWTLAITQWKWFYQFHELNRASTTAITLILQN